MASPTFEALRAKSVQPAQTSGGITAFDALKAKEGSVPAQKTKQRGALGKVASFVAPTITQSVEKLASGQGLSLRDVAGSALEAGSFLVPVGGIARGIGLAGKAGIRGAQAIRGARGAQTALSLGQKAALGSAVGGASGSLQGAGRAIGSGEDIGDIAKATIGGGVAGATIGGAFPLAGRIAGKGLEKIASRAPEERLGEMTRNLRTLQNTFEKGVRKKKVGDKVVEVSNPIKTLKTRKLIPEVVDGRTDTTKMIQSLNDELDQLFTQRTPTLVGSKKTVSLKQLQSDVARAIKSSKELKSSGQVNTTLKKADTILKDFRQSFGDKIKLKDLDDIRIVMNKRFDPDLNDAFRSIGDAARKHVYRLDKASRGSLEQQGELLAARRFAEALNNRAVKGGRLGGYVSSILGAMVGGTLQVPVAGPILGALGGRALDRTIRDAYFKAPGAKVAQKLLGAGEKVDRVVFGGKR